MGSPHRRYTTQDPDDPADDPGPYYQDDFQQLSAFAEQFYAELSEADSAGAGDQAYPKQYPCMAYDSPYDYQLQDQVEASFFTTAVGSH